MPRILCRKRCAIKVTGNLANDRDLDRDPRKLAALIRDIIDRRGFTVFAPVRVMIPREVGPKP